MLKMLAAILLSTVLSGCEATSKEPSPQTLEKIENITQDDLLSSEEKFVSYNNQLLTYPTNTVLGMESITTHTTPKQYLKPSKN